MERPTDHHVDGDGNYMIRSGTCEGIDKCAECETLANIVGLLAAYEEITKIVHCKDCRLLYFKAMSAHCPYRVGPCRPDGFCDRGVNRYDG